MLSRQTTKREGWQATTPFSETHKKPRVCRVSNEADVSRFKWT